MFFLLADLYGIHYIISWFPTWTSFYLRYPYLCSLRERGFRGKHICGVTLLSGIYQIWQPARTKIYLFYCSLLIFSYRNTSILFIVKRLFCSRLFLLCLFLLYIAFCSCCAVCHLLAADKSKSGKIQEGQNKWYSKNRTAKMQFYIIENLARIGQQADSMKRTTDGQKQEL